MKKIRKIFLTGLVVILPIGITLWVLKMLFDKIDPILGGYINKIIGKEIPGLGLLAVILIIMIVGIVTNNYLGKKLVQWMDMVFVRIPIIKTIYAPLKDILKSVSNENSNNFKKAVFVDYPKEGSLSIGFITKEDVIFNGEKRTAIFVPTTPNPTSGFLLYLTREDYQELDMPVDVALKTIISLGNISPEVINKYKKNIE